MARWRISISRTRDMELVKKIWGDPSLYFLMRDDGCPDDPMGWFPLDSEKRYFLVIWLDGAEKIPIGIIAYYALSQAMCEIHIGILPQFQHQNTVEMVHLSNDWIFHNSPCEKILAFVPTIKPEVKRLAEKCGFKKEAFLSNSFLLDGALTNQYLFTLGRQFYERTIWRRWS